MTVKGTRRVLHKLLLVSLSVNSTYADGKKKTHAESKNYFKSS